jgi:thiamine pyrophosphokinase
MDNNDWLIMGGGTPPSISLKDKIDWQDRKIICADSGANHAYRWGITPDVICGDLDSIDDSVRSFFEDLGVEFLTYPVDKDWTDTELAISVALERGGSDLVFVGLDGGRIDHQFTNYLLIARMSMQGRMRILGEQGWTFFLNEKLNFLQLEGVLEKTISVIPLEVSSGICYAGMKYLLTDEQLNFGSSRGMSNVAIQNTVSIRFDKGLLMVIVND